MFARVRQKEEREGDKTLQFSAYCLVAGLASARRAQAPSGHVSTGL